MKKILILFCFTALAFFSCKTVDIEKDMQDDLAKENKSLKEDLENAKKALEMRTKEDEYIYDVEPVVVNSKEYVVVRDSDLKVAKEDEKKRGADAVQQSLKDSFIELEDFVGGTSYFDYDKDRQYPIFTKQLALTTIMLNSDESMSVESNVFMSDTTRWEVTGDIFPGDGTQRQLIFVKPKAANLETNMTVVTDKRLYHFVLYSTSKNYQPMVEFRYPNEKPFRLANTKHEKPKEIKSIYDNLDPDNVSFNYRVSVPVFQKRVDWVPKTVYDDGSHTYILLPDVVLQKEMPAVWEGKNEITNYEVDPEHHNLIIINKLVEKVTLKVGKQKVVVTKKKGVPISLAR